MHPCPPSGYIRPCLLLATTLTRSIIYLPPLILLLSVNHFSSRLLLSVPLYHLCQSSLKFIKMSAAHAGAEMKVHKMVAAAVAAVSRSKMKLTACIHCSVAITTTVVNLCRVRKPISLVWFISEFFVHTLRDIMTLRCCHTWTAAARRREFCNNVVAMVIVSRVYLTKVKKNSSILLCTCSSFSYLLYQHNHNLHKIYSTVYQQLQCLSLARDNQISLIKTIRIYTLSPKNVPA